MAYYEVLNKCSLQLLLTQLERKTCYLQQHTLAITIDPVLSALSLIGRAPSFYSGISSIRMVSDDGQPYELLSQSRMRLYRQRLYVPQ